MNRQATHSLLLTIGFLVSTGCAGYDRILFATKTNIGLDLDDQPPTAEITLARRELAITPTFQDAQGEDKTLPLLASFGLAGNFLDPEITSRFAGGEAAVVLAYGPTWKADHNHPQAQSEAQKQPKGEAFLCLSKEPDTRSWLKKKWDSVFGRSNEDTRAFYFATDTAFGLKAAWDGTTGPYPSTVKLGYNRKELAFPPIYATPAEQSECSSSPTPLNTSNEPSKASGHNGPWKVTVPSFVASLDNSSTISDVWEWFKGEGQTKHTEQAKDGERKASGVTHIQFFATGRAASEFVKRPDVNEAMNRTMYLRRQPLIDPLTVTISVSARQTFKVSGGTGLVKFTLMLDSTGGATVEPATGVYTAGPSAGMSIVGAADEGGKIAIATVTVK